jgi:hypothetical protein
MKKMYLVFICAIISLTTMAQAGTLQWAKCFGGSGNDSARAVANTADGGYYVAGVTYSNDGNVTGNHNPTGNFSDVWVIKVDASGNLVWEKTFGGSFQDQANSIYATNDGGAIIAGSTNSDDGDVTGLHGAAGGATDFWVIKIDNTGTLQWQNTYGGSKNDYATSIKQTRDGGYVVAGNTYSDDSDVSGNHDPSGAAADFWVVKLNSTGTLQWQKCYGGSLQDDANSIIQTADDGYLIGGDTYSDNGDVTHGFATFVSGIADYWVVKIDSIGGFTWQACLGGSYSSIATSVIQATSTEYFAQGYTYADNDNVSGNFGGSSGATADNWLVNISGGNMNWQNTFGGSATDFGQSIIQLRNGHMVTTGASNSNNPGTVSNQHGGYDVWTYEVSSSGYPPSLWQNCFGGSAADGGYGLVETTDSDVVEVGYTASTDGNVSGNHGGSDFWVIKVQTETGAVSSTNGIQNVTIADNSFNLYPNPAHSYVTINVSDNLIGNWLEVSDAVGRVISRQQINTGKFNLQTGNLANGVYFVRAGENGNADMVKKLVVE